MLKTKAALAAGLQAIGRTAPWAKSLLPKSFHRFILLHIADVNRGYAGFKHKPSRKFLERDVLPWLRDNYSRVLFVGTAPYTYHYEEVFADQPSQFVTIDPNPGVEVWGSCNHVVGRIQDVDRHLPRDSVDSVVINGVFGFGINDMDDLRLTMHAIQSVLRAGGFLVVGWNTDHPEPWQCARLEPHFTPSAAPWGVRKDFDGETHVYDFYVRNSD